MRATILVAIALITLISVGETSVIAMGAPTAMSHSQAHVMGFMCKGGGRGPQARDANADTAGEDSSWRMQDTTVRVTTYFSSDPLVGILEFLNKADCEASARMLNRARPGRYVCVIVKR